MIGNRAKLMVALIAIGLTTLTGCGGSSGGSGADPEAEIRSQLVRAADHLEREEVGEYCEMLTDKAREDLKQTEGFEDASCESAVIFSLAFLEKNDLKTMATPESIVVKGDTALIEYPKGSGFSSSRFDLVDGRRMIGPDPGADEDEITRNRVKGWIDSWCDVKIAMSRGEVIKIMGEPTDEFDGSSGGTPSLSYGGFDHQFSAFLNLEGSVKQLDATVENETDLSCPRSRK